MAINCLKSARLHSPLISNNRRILNEFPTKGMKSKAHSHLVKILVRNGMCLRWSLKQAIIHGYPLAEAEQLTQLRLLIAISRVRQLMIDR